MGAIQIAHIPYPTSIGIPRGCGGSILGGGTAGGRGDIIKERAGDVGEYHHSRNLMKKMEVGRRRRRESKMR